MTTVAAGAAAIGVAAVAIVGAVALPPEPGPYRSLGHPDRAPLNDIGWSRGLMAWEAIRAGGCLAAAIVSFAIGLPAALVLAAAVGPSVWVRMRAQAAQDRSRRALAALVPATESALRSGVPLPEALRRGSESIADPFASRPIDAALRSFELGSSLADALSEAAGAGRDRRERDVLATLALGIEERLPRERLADLLASIAERLSFEDGLADEVTARAAGARQQQWLLAALVPALAIYLAATMPMLAATLSSDLGRFVLLPVAGVLEIGGILLSRRVVRGSMP